MRVTSLNHVGVFDHARGVEKNRNVERAAVGIHLAHVIHGDWLAARHVDRVLERNVRDFRGAVLFDHRLELVQVDVAFPRTFALWVMSFVNDDVSKNTPGDFLVQLGGREIHVARHDLARLDHDFGKNLLGGATLVSGDNVLIASRLTQGFDQFVVCIRACRCGLGTVVSRPLASAHRRGAGVGE